MRIESKGVIRSHRSDVSLRLVRPTASARRRQLGKAGSGPAGRSEDRGLCRSVNRWTVKLL